MASFSKDITGQVMLTTAFIFVMVIVLITLMLNNVIYANNVAYQGFLDQSVYDDASLKQVTLDETAYAYQDSAGDVNKFDSLIADYVKSINTLTVSNGKYVTLQRNQYVPMSNPNPYALTTLTLYNSKYEKSYSIKTNYKPSTPIVLMGGSDPATDCIVKLATNWSEVRIGIDQAVMIVKVTDLNNMPLPNVALTIRGSAGIINNNPFNDISSGGSCTLPYATDYDGKATFIYSLSGSGDLGLQTLNVSVGPPSGRTFSNNVTIFGVEGWALPIPTACTDTIDVGSPSPAYSSKKVSGVWSYYVTITIPVGFPAGTDYDFENIGAGVCEDSSSIVNLAYISSGVNFTDHNGASGPGVYSRDVSMKFKIIDRNLPWSVTLNVKVSADCIKEEDPVTHDPALYDPAPTPVPASGTYH